LFFSQIFNIIILIESRVINFSLKLFLILISFLFTFGSNSAQTGDVCPIMCGEKVLTWTEEIEGVHYHNEYMNMSWTYGCCHWECIDFLWLNEECKGEFIHALNITKIYTHTDAYPDVLPPYECQVEERSVYMRHLTGLLKYLIFNGSNPANVSAWDFSTIPPTPPWVDDNDPEEFVIRVYQPYCWALNPEEHDCFNPKCKSHRHKRMVLELCSEVECPCCYFDYYFEYESYAPGYVTITDIIHVAEDLEYQCSDEDCCYTCSGKGKDKWQLEINEELWNSTVGICD
jgi:hypothetical protein